MPTYNKQILAEKAKELSVVRDTLEEVMRLRDILAFFDNSELLSDSLALKGGTAINLIFFDLPRLSVDIDLDFCVNISRKDMMEKRERIGALIEKYMIAEGYGYLMNTEKPVAIQTSYLTINIQAEPYPI